MGYLDLDMPLSRQIEPGELYHFVDKAQVSIHHILEDILKITGPADVSFTAFSISESSLRCLSNLVDKGLILSLKAIFDFTVRKNKLSLLLFSSEFISEIRLADVHAKLILIKNKQFKVVINTSGNLNDIKRWEAGIISFREKDFEFYRDNFWELFEEGIEYNCEA